MRTRKLQFFNFLIDSGTHWIFICWIVMSPGVWRSLHGSSEGGTIKLMRKRDMNLQLTRVYETLLCDAMSCERALKLRNKTKSQLCCCLTQPEWEYLFRASCAGCCVVKGSDTLIFQRIRGEDIWKLGIVVKHNGTPEQRIEKSKFKLR